MPRKILVTGGAGYIGSHAAEVLAESGLSPIIYDNLSLGHREAAGDFPLIEGDIRDTELVERALVENKIEAVMHFAAFAQVGESVGDPLKYYENNTAGSASILRAMVAAGVKYFVLSSTAAVYGEPEKVPIAETDGGAPTNPYGASKQMVERILADCRIAHGIESVCLRYFNACGADPSGKIGEDHDPETHLIPIVLQAAAGLRKEVVIFGDDYDTPDGSCIRDYIHVNDLAAAHVLAVEWLFEGNPSRIYNLGNGAGYSVKEVVETARKVTGRDIPVRIGERRPGDPSRLVASSEKIISELGFDPKFADLNQIIETAWNWHSARPNGYDD